MYTTIANKQSMRPETIFHDLIPLVKLKAALPREKHALVFFHRLQTNTQRQLFYHSTAGEPSPGYLPT